MHGIFQGGPMYERKPQIGGFVQFLFSLDVTGDEEVNDTLVSLVFRAARSAADFSPIDSVCAYLPCTVGVQGRGIPDQ